jgi:hypothetical protein
VNARYHAHQMVRPMEFSSTELHLNLFIRSLAHPFNSAHGTVKCALRGGCEDPPGRGRHRELSPEDEHALVECIAKKGHNNTAVTRTEFLNCCIATFGENGLIHFCSATPQNFLKRKVPLKTIKDLKSLESSFKSRLKAYEPMYRMPVQTLSLISTKLD